MPAMPYSLTTSVFQKRLLIHLFFELSTDSAGLCSNYNYIAATLVFTCLLVSVQYGLSRNSCTFFARHVCMPRRDAFERFILNYIFLSLFSTFFINSFTTRGFDSTKRKSSSQELSRLQQDFEAPETKLTFICSAWQDKTYPASQCAAGIQLLSHTRSNLCRLVQACSDLSNIVGTMWAFTHGHSKFI